MKPKNPNVIYLLAILVLLSTSFSLKSKAQEGAYWSGLSSKNPAAIGTPSEWISGYYNFSEELDIKGYAFAADLELSPKFGSIGIIYASEEVRTLQFQQIELCYAYTKQINDKGEISFGVSLGSELFVHRNKFVSNPNKTKSSFLNPSVGLFYYGKNFDFGLSYSHFHTLKDNIDEDNLSLYPEVNIVTILGSYRLIINNILTIEPNVLFDFRKDNSDIWLGMALKYDQLWAAYDYSDEKWQTVMLGIDLNNKIRIGVSYNYREKPESPDASFSSNKRIGITEFVLGFNIH